VISARVMARLQDGAVEWRSLSRRAFPPTVMDWLEKSQTNRLSVSQSLPRINSSMFGVTRKEEVNFFPLTMTGSRAVPSTTSLVLLTARRGQVVAVSCAESTNLEGARLTSAPLSKRQ